jgi:hypothetical protein
MQIGSVKEVNLLAMSDQRGIVGTFDWFSVRGQGMLSQAVSWISWLWEIGAGKVSTISRELLLRCIHSFLSCTHICLIYIPICLDACLDVFACNRKGLDLPYIYAQIHK